MISDTTHCTEVRLPQLAHTLVDQDLVELHQWLHQGVDPGAPLDDKFDKGSHILQESRTH